MSEQEPWSVWITTESIANLHKNVIQRWGGASSQPKQGCVEAALGAAFNATLYAPEDEQSLSSGLTFAGYLLFYLSTKHCFLDGNKRISLASCLFVLLALGLTIDVTRKT